MARISTTKTAARALSATVEKIVELHPELVTKVPAGKRGKSVKKTDDAALVASALKKTAKGVAQDAVDARADGTAAAKTVASKSAKKAAKSAPAPKSAPAKKTAKSAPAAKSETKVPGGVKGWIIAAMARPEGVTEKQVCEKTGWPRAGATISKAIKLAGFAVDKSKNDDGRMVYRKAK